MQQSQIILQWVSAFLDLLHTRDVPADEREARLEQVLDMLAVVRHQAATGGGGPVTSDPPGWPYQDRRVLVADCYPRLGLYHMVDQEIEGDRPPAVLVGDAVDDVADIAGDLHDVRWRWAHTSPEDALWHFRFTYDHHWGEHLRRLQWYLHGLRRPPGDGRPAPVTWS